MRHTSDAVGGGTRSANSIYAAGSCMEPTAWHAVAHLLAYLARAALGLLGALEWTLQTLSALPLLPSWFATSLSGRRIAHIGQRLQAARAAVAVAAGEAIRAECASTGRGCSGLRGDGSRRGSRLVIIGCGLSGAQLACEALRRGWTSVRLLCRSGVVVRPFDIDEAWVARHLSSDLQPCESDFYGASFAERRRILARARPGGSVTPSLLRKVLEMQRSGRGLELMQHTQVLDAKWKFDGNGDGNGSDDGDGEWLLHVREDCCASGAGSGSGSRDGTLKADAIWLATGHRIDVAAAEPLRSLRRLRPQPAEHDGLPELTPSLRWDEATPLYVSGSLSALQLGPDALNLAGAGLSAARIVSDMLVS